MIRYSCSLSNEPALSRVPNKDAFETRFEFRLTPIEYVGRPDEEQHQEQRCVDIDITGHTIDGWNLGANQNDLLRVLFWYAKTALAEQSKSVTITSCKCPIDPQREIFPAAGPLVIDLPGPKMGFR